MHFDFEKHGQTEIMISFPKKIYVKTVPLDIRLDPTKAIPIYNTRSISSAMVVAQGEATWTSPSMDVAFVGFPSRTSELHRKLH